MTHKIAVLSLSACICFTFIFVMLFRFLLGKIYMLSLTPKTDEFKGFLAFINNSKYFLIYFAHTYILYLWLYAVGQDIKQLRRFKIIYGCSIFLYACSVFYRWAILFFPAALLNTWVLVFCILIFGINALFRASLEVGMLADHLILLAKEEKFPQKLKIEQLAEIFETYRKVSSFGFGNRSAGQIKLLKNYKLPTNLNNLYLTEKTKIIQSKYDALCNFALFCGGCVIFFFVKIL